MSGLISLSALILFHYYQPTWSCRLPDHTFPFIAAYYWNHKDTKTLMQNLNQDISKPNLQQSLINTGTIPFSRLGGFLCESWLGAGLSRRDLSNRY